MPENETIRKRAYQTKVELPARANLGCGQDYREGWHNVDVRPHAHADENADLDEFPWPWPDNCFESVLMDNVIEHLQDRYQALHELHRVVEPGGMAVLRYPHWHSAGAFKTPSHTTTLTRKTWTDSEVDHLFEVRELNAQRVRFGRLLPERAALWLGDHIGHIVSEVEVKLEVLCS